MTLKNIRILFSGSVCIFSLGIFPLAYAQTEVEFNQDVYKSQREAETARLKINQALGEKHIREIKLMCETTFDLERTKQQKRRCSAVKARQEKLDIKKQEFLQGSSPESPVIIETMETAEQALEAWKNSTNRLLESMKGRSQEPGKLHIVGGYGLATETVGSYSEMQASKHFNAIAMPVLISNKCKIIERHATGPYLADHTFSGQIIYAKCGDFDFIIKDIDNDLVKHGSAKRNIQPEFQNIEVKTGHARAYYIKTLTGEYRVRYSWAKHGRYIQVSMSFNENQITNKRAYAKGESILDNIVEHYVQYNL